MARLGTLDDVRVRFALYYAKKRRLARISAESSPIAEIPLTKIDNLEDLNSVSSYGIVTSGAAWGDSITLNNHSNVMLASGALFSEFINLDYAPSGSYDIISHGDWPTEIASLVGTFSNEGAGGETSSQILSRMISAGPSDVDVVSWGTNDGTSTAQQETIYSNIDAVLSNGFDPDTTIFMPSKAGGLVTANSYGRMAYARNKGFQWFDWNTALVKQAHRMDSASTDLPTTLQQGDLTRAFMSSPNPNGPVDINHPGSAFSEAVSKELASMVSAIAGASSPPYMRMQVMSVDWSVPEGTIIGTLDTIGAVTHSFINNDFGNSNLITLSGTNVLRGSAPAPAHSWVDFFIEVRNSHGSFVQRLSLGRSTGLTKFGKAFPVVQNYLTGLSADTGTISIVGKQNTSTTSRFISIGSTEIQIRNNGDLWFKNPFSSNVIFGGNTGDHQHWMMTWSGSTCYTVLGTTYTDRSSIFNGATLNGAMSLFGATSGTTAAVTDDTFEVEHIFISDSYHGPGTDLSPIFDGTQSSITGPSDHLGTVPVYSMRGGPGNFASKNYGNSGVPGVFPFWDAANAKLR